MTAPENLHRASTPVTAVPAQTRRRLPAPAADRIVRQVEAIGTWNAARRMRERLLDAASGRLDREAASRQGDVLRRTHQAIVERTADELAQRLGPMMLPGLTAVIAHRHPWFAQKVAGLLQGAGVTVAACTDSGADALAAVVVEQPDVLLVGEQLAMMPGDVLLAEARLFAPATLLAVQIGDRQQADAWRTRADAVFLRMHPPEDVAAGLRALCRPAAEHCRQ